MKHADEVPPRARTLAANVPPVLDEAIAAMLAKAASERPSMTDLQRALATISLEPIAAHAPGRARPRHRAAGDRPWPRPSEAPGSSGLSQDSTLQGAAAARVDGSHRPLRPLVLPGVAAVAIGAAGYLFVRVAAPTAMACPSDMVAVPGGTFAMGSPGGSGAEDEHPRHRVTLSSFCIDRTEVTANAYARCAVSGACTAKTADDQLCNGARSDRQDHPINCVDWSQAAAYCAFVHKRLPSEAEWEYAARGGEGRTYPWGEDPPSPRRLNVCGSECTALGRRRPRVPPSMDGDRDDSEATVSATGLPDGATAQGVLHMAGNVSEWTADRYGRYEATDSENPRGPGAGQDRVIRGGGWTDDSAASVRGARRHHASPDHSAISLGFRCAR